MEAPNTPNPENPNAQGDQNQYQVPAGQVPAPMPAQPVPQLIPSTTGPCWCCTCSSNCLSKLDR